MQYTHPNEDGSISEESAPLNLGAGAPGMPRVGRNDPCPCRSGRKVKKCCGA